MMCQAGRFCRENGSLKMGNFLSCPAHSRSHNAERGLPDGLSSVLRRVAMVDPVEAGGELVQPVKLFFFEALVQGTLYTVSAPRAFARRRRGGGCGGVLGRGGHGRQSKDGQKRESGRPGRPREEALRNLLPRLGPSNLCPRSGVVTRR